MKEGITVGMDLGDRNHIAVVFDSQGTELEVASVGNNKAGLNRFFSKYPAATIALEAGTHSAWVSRYLSQMGCEVFVGNPRRLAVIWCSHDKSDERDARILAMVCRVDPRFMSPIQHRSSQAHADLGLIKSRDILVRTRTKLINHLRGTVKSVGERLPSCSTRSFVRRAGDQVPEQLCDASQPVLKIIEELNERIDQLGREIERISQEKYPETERLRQVPGVGPITALAYVLTLEEPGRFGKSREVGAYLGLTPRRDQSGQSDKQLRISKAGNTYLRQLLVGCAHYIIGPFGPPSDLRRHGLSIAARGGKNAKKRAVVAVARKLAVVLHRLWVTGATYVPLAQGRKAA